MKPEIEWRPKPRIKSGGASKSWRAMASDTQPATPDPKSLDEVTALHRASVTVQSEQPSQILSVTDINAMLAAFQAKEEKRKSQVRDAVRRYRAKRKVGK